MSFRRPTAVRLAAIAVALLAVLALSACGTPKSEDAVDPNADPLATEQSKSTTPAAELLPAAEVAQISGIKGVKLVEKGSTDRATGDANYANDKGGIFLVVQMGTAQNYEGSIGGDEYEKPVSGIGDGAFIGPKKSQSATPNMLVFKKGENAASLIVFFKGPKETVLTMDQMKQLAQSMASRM